MSSLGARRPPGGENGVLSGTGRTMTPVPGRRQCLRPRPTPSKYLRLTDTQDFFLPQWAEGWFRDDAGSLHPAEALTRAVLEYRAAARSLPASR
jgi:hypothetical protein